MDTLNVFLVDNDQYNLNLYRQYLASQGYQNVNVFNNTTEYTIYLDQRPDVVFLGNCLGQKLGLELLKSFKSVDPDIDVILLPEPAHKGSIEVNTQTGEVEASNVDAYVLDYMTDVLNRLSAVNRFIKRSA